MKATIGFVFAARLTPALMTAEPVKNAHYLKGNFGDVMYEEAGSRRGSE